MKKTFKQNKLNSLIKASLLGFGLATLSNNSFATEEISKATETTKEMAVETAKEVESKGVDLIGQIKETVGKVQDNAKELTEKATNVLTQSVDKGKEVVNQVVESKESKGFFDSIKESANNLVEDTKNIVSKSVDVAKETTSEVVEELKQKTEKLNKKTKEALETTKEESGKKSEEFKEKVKDFFANPAEKNIKQSLTTALGIPAEEVTDAKFKKLETGNFYIVELNSGEPLIISENGKYLAHGGVFELNNEATKQSEKVKNVLIVEAVKDLKELEPTMIVYKAPQEKHVITVLADITCSYCNKLVSEIPKYNELGITVRLMAYPRAGLDSDVAKQMEAIFTSENPAKTYVDVENGQKIELAKEIKVIDKHYKFGSKVGLTGTPFIITDTYQTIPGYVSPYQLIENLEKDEQ